EEESYLWIDTEDFSGGRTYGAADNLSDGWEYAAGEAPRVEDIGKDAQAFFEEFTKYSDSPIADVPGYYHIDRYSVEAGWMSPTERAVFLQAMALGDDVTYYGATAARNGQDGVAFGGTRVEDDIEIELITVINPQTGMVIETDEIYPNDLPGAPAVVEEYVLIVESEFSDVAPVCGASACPGS